MTEEETLEELQKENERLKAMQQELGKISKIQQEIQRLKQENKQLEFRLKHGKAVDISKKIVDKTAHFGVKAFSLIQRYGRHLAKAEQREKAVNRKLNASVKKRR